MTFLYRLRVYEVAAMGVLDRSENGYFKRLGKEMVRAHSINLLINYKMSYGLDYDALDRLLALYRRRNKEQGFTFNDDSASKAVRPKVFTPEQGQRLDSLARNSFDVNDSALFVHSENYRSIIGYVVNTTAFQDHSFSMENIHLAELTVSRRLSQNPYIRDAEAFLRIAGLSLDELSRTST